MVFVWSNLVDGEPHFALSQVALNDTIMLVAFAPLVGLLLGLSSITVPCPRSGPPLAARSRRGRCEQYATLWGDTEGPLEPIAKNLGKAVTPALAIYENTFRDACVMEWTLEETTMELTARLQPVSLG